MFLIRHWEVHSRSELHSAPGIGAQGRTGPAVAVGQWSCACRRAGFQQAVPAARQVDFSSA